MNAHGIDISIWQDDNSTAQMMDFAKAKTKNVDFVFIKASQSTWIDQDFINNWQHAQEQALARGPYHFLTWDKTAKEQARFFAGLLKNDAGALPPVPDFECRTNAPGKNAMTEGLYAFCNETEAALGKETMIYTSPGFWGEFWSGAHADYFAARKLWIAHYYVQAPKVPAPWTDWEFWQYGLGKGEGQAYGAESKDIDLDWFNGDRAAFYTKYVGGAMPPENDPPVVVDPPVVAKNALRMRIVRNVNSRIGPSTGYASRGIFVAGAVTDVVGIGGGASGAWALLEDGTWFCVKDIYGNVYAVAQS